MEKKEFLGTEPVGKLLFKLSMPAILAQIINLLYNIVDKVYIGHIKDVGDLALTGIGVCMPIIMIVSAFAALVAMGAAPKASIALGEKNTEKAEKILGNSIFLLTIMSVILTIIVILFKRELCYFFGASENTIEYAVDYLTIYAIGTIFVQFSLGLNAFISAQGFAFWSMVTVLIGAVSNIILDPLFIFVFDMGVKGAAIATIISQMISAVFVISFMCGKKTYLKITLKNLKPNFKIMMSFIALGFAPFIMQASESVIMVCFNKSLLKYGGDIAVTAMTVMISIMQLTMLPLQGLGQGSQPIMSYNFGAKNADRVREVFFKLLLCSVVYSFVIWGALMLFPSTFVKIFNNKPELIEFTSWAIRRYLMINFIMGVQMACQMSLISTGSAKESAIIAIVRKFVLLIPLIYILPNFFSDKVLAVFLSEPIADFIAVSFTSILFAVRFTQALKKLKAEKLLENSEINKNNEIKESI